MYPCTTTVAGRAPVADTSTVASTEPSTAMVVADSSAPVHSVAPKLRPCPNANRGSMARASYHRYPTKRPSPYR